MRKNLSLYEINTRVFLKKFADKSGNINISYVPESYWDSLKEKGFDYIWLMGVWKTCSSAIEGFCYEEDLVKAYSKALRDWQKEDVIGSPYSIDSYEFNPALGSTEDFYNVKSLLNNKGMKLILDFVPNHLSVHTHLLKTNPEIFLEASEENYNTDNHTFFKSDNGKYYAHGRDPFFPAWQDTVQINYYSLEARKFMDNVLLDLTDVCDGLRCDMAMLVLNNTFYSTWVGALKNYPRPEKDYWADTIAKIKAKREDFIMIAEAYWDLEWVMQQQGFDYTYDKTLTERIRSGYIDAIKGHLQADTEYQQKSVRFLENHDEERTLSIMNCERNKTASAIIATIQGLKLYNDGQLEGRKIKLPVQLGREWAETENKLLKAHYDKLLSITKAEIFKSGKWTLLEPEPGWDGNFTYVNMLSWLWTYKDEHRLVVINHSETLSKCRIKLSLEGFPEEVEFIDLMNDKTYLRSAEEINSIGLYVELKPFNTHIFKF